MKLNNSQIQFIAQLIKFQNINIENIKNKLVRDIVINIKLDEYDNDYFDINDICTVFMPGFSEEDIKKFGITYTPVSLTQYMYSDVLDYSNDRLLESKIADISMGNGAFFIGLIIYLKNRGVEFSIPDFVKNNLFGFDIKKENILSAKLVLSLLTLYYGEDIEEIHFNLYAQDFIDNYLQNINTLKFDVIVGNPPYVKQQNIEKEYRSKLENNFSTIYSNYNLYYAFIEMATKIIRENGKILLLVPNYLLKIKSAFKLREYLLNNYLIEKIVDFKYFKLFDGIDTYSMILQLSKDSKVLNYKTAFSKHLNDLENQDWNQLLPTNNLVDSINLTNSKENELIEHIISQPQCLEIATGIATQKDKLYLIDKVVNQEETKYYKLKDGIEYEIEEKLVKKIIKGSGTSKKGVIKEQYIIFPYKKDSRGNVFLLSENELKRIAPKGYYYFLTNKDSFFERSASLDDSNWFQYGRSQSLNRENPKIIFPTNSNKPQFRFYREHALFYNGYAIFGIKNKKTSEIEMQAITILLNSEIVNIFMNLTSYYIGGGFLSYQKKYIEKFRIPNLSKKNIKSIIELSKINDFSKLNSYIFQLYGLNYQEYKNIF